MITLPGIIILSDHDASHDQEKLESHGPFSVMDLKAYS